MDKPPCILFLLDWKPESWSTREESYLRLSRALAQRGIAPVLIVSEIGDQDVLRRMEAAGARLIACRYHARMLAYWGRIREVTREYSVKLAVVCFFDYFTAVHWMCRLSGIRRMLYNEVNSGTWQGKGWKAALVRWRTAMMCRPVDKFLAISGFIRERMIRTGIPARRIDVIFNGVDLDTFHPDAEARHELRRNMDVQDRTFVVLFAAVFLKWKRPGIALECCAELVRRGVDVQLWMAGDGPLRESLEAAAARLGIGGNVRFLGRRPDPQRWMSAADVLLHTSVGEAFGQVYVEAMACGIPVVATGSGAVAELVEDGVCGRLVPPGPNEVPELADAIQDLAADPAKYNAMAAAAPRRSQLFGIDAWVNNNLAAYRSILAWEEP